METRLGFEFRNVRIHDDAPAARSAATLGARAYTTGSRIMFGAGAYRPRTADGARLLAHELTHVKQQATTPATPVIQRAPLDRRKKTLAEQAGEINARPDEIAWSLRSPGFHEKNASTGTHSLTNFGINRHTPKPEHLRYLKNEIYHNELAVHPMARIGITGHASRTGSAWWNRRLSKRRALGVHAAFKKIIEKPIRHQFRLVAGKGYKSRLGSNATVLGRARNRRVDIRLYKARTRPQAAFKRRLIRGQRGIKLLTVNVSGLSIVPFKDSVKKTIQAAFAPLPVVKFDWKGGSPDATVLLTFTNKREYNCKRLGNTEGAAVSTVYVDCIKTRRPRFKSTDPRLGRVVANTACHELAHSLALEESSVLGNYMFTSDLTAIGLIPMAMRTAAQRAKLQEWNSKPAAYTQSQYRRMLVRIKELQRPRRGSRFDF